MLKIDKLRQIFGKNLVSFEEVAKIFVSLLQVMLISRLTPEIGSEFNFGEVSIKAKCANTYRSAVNLIFRFPGFES